MRPVTPITRALLALAGLLATALIAVGLRPWDALAQCGTTYTVHVGPSGTFTYSPSSLTIKVGDSVKWVFDTSGHTVTSGTSCTADGRFCSPNDTNCASGATSGAGATYQHTFKTAGTFRYFCATHCAFNMAGSVTVQ
jgi:plastocyanin